VLLLPEQIEADEGLAAAGAEETAFTLTVMLEHTVVLQEPTAFTK